MKGSQGLRHPARFSALGLLQTQTWAAIGRSLSLRRRVDVAAHPVNSAAAWTLQLIRSTPPLRGRPDSGAGPTGDIFEPINHSVEKMGLQRACWSHGSGIWHRYSIFSTLAGPPEEESGTAIPSSAPLLVPRKWNLAPIFHLQHPCWSPGSGIWHRYSTRAGSPSSRWKMTLHSIERV
jgi:hypothetical protein